MRPFLTSRGAWSVCLSVGLSLYSEPCKNGEAIEMLLVLRTRVGPMNHVLDGGSICPMGRGNFEPGWNGRAIVNSYRDTVPLSVQKAKKAEPIKTPFGLWTRVGQGTVCWMEVKIAPWEGTQFWVGKLAPIFKA